MATGASAGSDGGGPAPANKQANSTAGTGVFFPATFNVHALPPASASPPPPAAASPPARTSLDSQPGGRASLDSTCSSAGVQRMSMDWPAATPAPTPAAPAQGVWPGAPQQLHVLGGAGCGGLAAATLPYAPGPCGSDGVGGFGGFSSLGGDCIVEPSLQLLLQPPQAAAAAPLHHSWAGPATGARELSFGGGCATHSSAGSVLAATDVTLAMLLAQQQQAQAQQMMFSQQALSANDVVVFGAAAASASQPRRASCLVLSSPPCLELVGRSASFSSGSTSGGPHAHAAPQLAWALPPPPPVDAMGCPQLAALPAAPAEVAAAEVGTLEALGEVISAHLALLLQLRANRQAAAAAAGHQGLPAWPPAAAADGGSKLALEPAFASAGAFANAPLIGGGGCHLHQ